MLAPAHVGHLAMLRALIRQSAAEGSFESNLATYSPQSTDFFAKLKRALSHGYFVEEDPRTGQVAVGVELITAEGQRPEEPADDWTLLTEGAEDPGS